MTQRHVNFVLLGNARCGSNLLVQALMDHPEVRMLSEVLSPSAETRSQGWANVNPAAWTYPRGSEYQLGQDGAEFLARKVFAKEPSLGRSAFGCKMFQNHARFDDRVRTAWDYLVREPIHVVHMQRRNLLNGLMSREVAHRTQVWSRLPNEKSAAPIVAPFPIEVEACERYFLQITQWRRWIEESFHTHPSIVVEYERDLCGDFGATTAKLFDFLRVSPRTTAPGLVKQQQLTARQQLSNFDVLRRHFSSTPHAVFFGESDDPA